MALKRSERPKMSWSQLAVAHRLGEQPSIFIDDHGSKVELPGLELGELLVQAVGRQAQVETGEGAKTWRTRHAVPLQGA
jgi:hypothetical protein